MMNYICDCLSENQPISRLRFCLVKPSRKLYTRSSNFQQVYDNRYYDEKNTIATVIIFLATYHDRYVRFWVAIYCKSVATGREST